MYFLPWQQALFFVLLGLTVLQRMRPGWLAFVLLILCATAASLSFGGGLAAWICLPVAALGLPACRRGHYAVLWLATLTSFAIFYFSDYAVSRYDAQRSLSRLLHADSVHQVSKLHRVSKAASAVIFPIRFQAVRFLSGPIVGILVGLLTLACSLALGANLWHMMLTREKEDEAIAALWGSLALFSVGIAVIVLLGRGMSYETRYSPGADRWSDYLACAAAR